MDALINQTMFIVVLTFLGLVSFQALSSVGLNGA